MTAGPLPGPAIGAADQDVLREAASIGCGQALTALGRLCGRAFDMEVPEVWAERVPGALSDSLGALAEELLAVGVRLAGLLAGDLVLALPVDGAARLAAALGQPVEAEAALRPRAPAAPVGSPRGGADGAAAPGRPGPAVLGPLAESALLESGNVVGSAFVSAIARLVHGKLLLSVPDLARGSGRACLEALAPGQAARVALATRFAGRGWPEGELTGLVLVLPDPARLPALLTALRGHSPR